MNFFEVVKDAAAFFYSHLDQSEVVVGQDHVSSIISHVRAGDSHGDPDVGLLQRRGVVYAIASHRHDFPATL